MKFKYTFINQYWQTDNIYNRKKTLLFILFLFILILNLCFNKPISATSINKNEINSFFQQVTERKINSIECYYQRWGLLTRIGITEKSLRENSWFKSSVKNPDLSKLIATMKDRALKPIDLKDYSCDFRLGCVFFAENKEVFKLFFAGNIAVVMVNEQPYQTTPQLLWEIIQFLPKKAYDDMCQALLQEWVLINKLPSTKHVD